MLSDRDLAGQPDEKPVADVMMHDVTTIEPSATPGEELKGIVTTTDLLRALAKGAHPAPPPERFILRKRGPRKRRLMI